MKLKTVMVLIFVATYGVFFYNNTQTKNERIAIALEEQIKDLETNYNLTMDFFIQDAKSIRKYVENNQKIVELFLKAQNASEEQRVILRDELYKHLGPRYERMHERGILQFQFMFPDNKTFLRMHKPDKYDDDLTDVRYSFRHANKTKETVIGFEQGRSTHAFRYVFPYFDKKGNHLGAVEASLGSYTMQDKLLHVNKIHSHFLVNKNIFEVKAWETKDLIQVYTQSFEHKDYMSALYGQHNKEKLIEEKKNIITPLRDDIDKNIATKKPFALHVIVEDGAKVITFLPIKDTQEKEVVAYIVSYTDDHNIYNAHKDYKIYNSIIFIGLLLLFYFTYKNLRHKEELKTEIKEALAQNTKQLETLQQQSKMASMGEMIGAIAHQWRQPLNEIGISIQNTKYDFRNGEIDEKYIKEFIDENRKVIEFMSKTIDDFRDFFRVDKEKKDFNVKEAIEKVVSMLSAQLKDHQISLDISGDDFDIVNLESEFQQVILNIINNAKDALVENNIQNPKIEIALKDNSVYIKDNGGGVPRDIIERIFEPYYTTKEQGKGTGMGLYMSKMIIEDNMGGSLHVENDECGAVFTIELRGKVL